VHFVSSLLVILYYLFFSVTKRQEGAAMLRGFVIPSPSGEGQQRLNASLRGEFI
jgi:hypothetical protein